MGKDPSFARDAKELGKLLAENGIGVVYGGGNVGLMGVLSTSVMENGGNVTGIIPDFMAREVPHRKISRLITVDSMNQRKTMMFDSSDAFCVLPGGFGTLDEFFEVLTLMQLGFQDKPIYILNTDGFFDDLIRFLARLRDQGFIAAEHFDRITVVSGPGEVIRRLITPGATE